MWKVSAGAGDAPLTELPKAQKEPTAAELLRQAMTPPAEKPSLRQPPDRLLRTQLVICALLLLFLLAARQLGWPVFSACRAELSAALTEGIDPSEQAELVRFANSVVEGLRLRASSEKENGKESGDEAGGEAIAGESGQQPAQSTAAAQPLAAAKQPLTAIRLGSRAKTPQPPEGYSVESYLPLQPLSLPLSGFSVTSGYGWREHPVSGRIDFHTGVDLAAAEGTPIGAALEGIVLDTGRGRSYGNYVLLLHPDGLATRYCHMQYVFVRRGETVGQGGVLGTVGSTGMATGPHLHFELSFDDMHYDPTEALGL